MEELIWSQKYRPKKIADCILPKELKATFQDFVDRKEVPNMILAGGAGVGKTTVAMAMLEELGYDYILINGSLDAGIDTLRDKMRQFASTVSFSGGRKFIILDEADFLSASHVQPALRAFVEEYSKNCGFILTCNWLNRIIEPLHSRCTPITFNIKKSEFPDLAAQFYKRVVEILKLEGIEYDKPVVAEVIKKHFPDNRRIINELQRYSASGKIDSGILTDIQDVSLKSLVKFLKDKDFTNMRKWVAENLDNDPNLIYRRIYDQASSLMTKSSVPQAVLIIGKYQYQQAFAVDAEINLVCCLTELMIEAEWT